MGKQWKQWQTLFSCASKPLQMVTAAMKLKDAFSPWKESYDKPRQCIKKQRHYFADKGLSSQSYCSSSHHVWMWDLNQKEGWAPKNWWLSIVMLEKTLKSPLENKKIKPVSPKGNQPWIFTGLTDAEAEAKLQYFDHLIWKADSLEDLDAKNDWGQEEKGATEDEMVGWHHCLHGHEFEQTPGDSKGQGSLTGCSPWCWKVSDMT